MGHKAEESHKINSKNEIQRPVNLLGKIIWKIQKARKLVSTGRITKLPLFNNESNLRYGAGHLCERPLCLSFHMSSLSLNYAPSSTSFIHRWEENE